MTSFQISITPSRRAAARFVSRVRRALLKALAEEEKKRGIRQTDLARAIGVHRSVINRELRGAKDLTLGRVAELAWALGRKPVFELVDPPVASAGTNILPMPLSITKSDSQAAAGATFLPPAGKFQTQARVA